MSTRAIVSWMSAAALLVFVVSPLAAQEREKPKPPGQQPAKPEAGKSQAGKPEGAKPGQPEGMPPEMEAWMKYAEPGEHHKHLGVLEGNWNQIARMRFAPDAPWQESTGKAEYKWILGGRFLVERVQSEMADQPFEGFAVLGYDNFKKKYTSVWMDSMGTMMMYQEGTCDAAGKVFTYVGEYDDPSTGSKKTAKSVMRVVSNNKVIYEMSEVGLDGKEFVTLEVTSTRAP